MLHLAIFAQGYIGKIFTGKKTFDARISKIKCMPFESIEKNDLVLMKESGGPIVGYFLAGTVSFYENDDKKTINNVLEKYKDELSLPEEFDTTDPELKYLSLIEIKQPTKLRIPVKVRKTNLSGWISLDEESQKQIELF